MYLASKDVTVKIKADGEELQVFISFSKWISAPLLAFSSLFQNKTLETASNVQSMYCENHKKDTVKEFKYEYRMCTCKSTK